MKKTSPKNDPVHISLRNINERTGLNFYPDHDVGGYRLVLLTERGGERDVMPRRVHIGELDTILDTVDRVLAEATVLTHEEKEAICPLLVTGSQKPLMKAHKALVKSAMDKVCKGTILE